MQTTQPTDIKLTLDQAALVMRNDRQPREHQLRAAEVFLTTTRFGLFWDMGTGKTTAILLGLAIEATNRTNEMRTVILCPKNVIHSAWMADGVYFPHLKMQPVHGIGPAERELLIGGSLADVFVTTYELFRADSGKYLNAGINRIVVDESSKIKNHKAKTSQIVHGFSDRMRSVWCLSGEPAPNSEIEYWSQMRAVAPALVGSSFWRWAHTYFQALKKDIRGKEVIIGWRVIPERWATFMQAMKQYTWALDSDDVQDLPEQIDITVSVEMTSRQRSAYIGVEDELVLDVGDGTELDVKAQAKLMKTRQIANGWAYSDRDDGDRIVTTYGSTKLEAIVDLIEELIAQGEQIVVWIEFTHDVNLIADACFDRWPYRILDGRTKNAAADIADFQNHKVDILICHPASVGHGVTFTAARYAIFYSLSYSSEQHNQAKKRTHRMGQDRKCFYYYLTTKGTVETVVVAALQEKRNVSKAVLQYLKREVV